MAFSYVEFSKGFKEKWGILDGEAQVKWLLPEIDSYMGILIEDDGQVLTSYLYKGVLYYEKRSFFSEGASICVTPNNPSLSNQHLTGTVLLGRLTDIRPYVKEEEQDDNGN